MIICKKSMRVSSLVLGLMATNCTHINISRAETKSI